MRGQPAENPLHGDEPPETIVIHDREARFEVDVRLGQKTGLFLDQRENRYRVAEFAAGLDVLNLFAYTGGFSIHAALAGARKVTSIDLAGPVNSAAQRNFALSQLESAHHRFVTADCFTYLASALSHGERYGLVIVDPPSFAPSKQARPRALDAYRRLNRMALDVTAPGGWLVSASCSSHISLADLMDVLASAGQHSSRTVQIVEIRGASSDHPTRPGFPEGQYLKLIIAAVGPSGG